MDSILTHWDKFPEELLSSTEWANFSDLTIGTLVLNFFITYFGQQPAYKDLADDDVMAKLTRLG